MALRRIAVVSLPAWMFELVQVMRALEGEQKKHQFRRKR